MPCSHLLRTAFPSEQSTENRLRREGRCERTGTRARHRESLPRAGNRRGRALAKGFVGCRPPESRSWPTANSIASMSRALGMCLHLPSRPRHHMTRTAEPGPEVFISGTPPSPSQARFGSLGHTEHDAKLNKARSSRPTPQSRHRCIPVRREGAGIHGAAAGFVLREEPVGPHR